MQHDVVDEATTVLDYLEGVVVAAIAGRRDANEEVAGRVVAVLLEALISAGGTERVDRILSPEPGSSCRFELVKGAERTPVDGGDVFAKLVDAEPGSAIESVTDYLNRRVLEVAPDHGIAFLFPAPDRMRGPGTRDALERWGWTLAIWSRQMDAVPATPAPERSAAVDAAPATTPKPAPAAQTPPEPAPEATPAPAAEQAAPEQPAAEKPAPEQAAPEQPAAEKPAAEQPAAEKLAPEPPAPPAPAPLDPGVVTEAVRTALSEVALEIDLGAIDVAVSEAVAKAVAEALAAPTPAAAPDLDVERLADLVAERMPAAVDGTAAAETTLASASEQLGAQLEALAERLTAGARTLSAASDELAERARNADSHAERIAEAVDAGLDRLGRQVDRRVNELLTTATASRRTPRPAAVGEEVDLAEQAAPTAPAEVQRSDSGTGQPAPPA